MNFLEDLAAAGLGFAAGRITKSDSVETMSLEDLIKAYAEKRCGIYTCNNEFARQLHRIARKYEECDYNKLFGTGY